MPQPRAGQAEEPLQMPYMNKEWFKRDREASRWTQDDIQAQWASYVDATPAENVQYEGPLSDRAQYFVPAMGFIDTGGWHCGSED